MANELHYGQNAFSQGEITPRLGLRQADLEKFRDACETMNNWIPVPHGGMRSRPTTRYVGETETMTEASRLIPFVFNTQQTYALEFGNQYFRVWAAVAGVPGQIYSSGSTPEEVVTPYLEAELSLLDYAQDADVLYITCPGWQPRKVERLSATSFQISTLSVPDGPFCSLTHPSYSGVGTGITMASSATAIGAATFTAGSAFFTTDMAGQLIRIAGTTGTPAEQGYATLDTFNSTTSMAGTIVSTLKSGAATLDWALGAWGEETGWPEHVTMFQQRLCFGNTVAEPDMVWMSKSAEFEKFLVGTDDADGVTARVATGEVNEINWLSSSRQSLLVGTEGAEFSLTGGNDLAVSPSNTIPIDDSNYGSEIIRPAKVPKGLIYVEKGGRKLNNITYSFEDDSFGSTDVTLFAEHLTANNPILEIAYQKRRDPIVWARLTDGTMMGVTWMPIQKIISAHTHSFTNGTVESFIILPANNAQDDEMWCIMKRTINGSTVRYVEYFDDDLGLDSALTASAAGTRTISGLSHLEGETVQIIGDGAVYNDQVVTSGSVTINDDEIDITDVEVGLHTDSTAVTIEPYVELRNGVSFGRTKSWGELNVKVINTLTLDINGQRILARDVDDLMHSVPTTPAKDVFTVMGDDPADDCQVTIEKKFGLKAHVLGLYGQMSIGD